MNWFKENKFLGVFLGVVVLLAGVLVFLILGAMSRYDTASGNYESQSAELIRLESLQPYPDAGNLKKFEEQKADYVSTIEGLVTQAAEMKIPEGDVTPEAFQSALFASVTAFTTKAADASMKLPERFSMGFERYKDSLPKAEAAPLLARDLKAIELVLGYLLEHKILEIEALTREDIPEEGESASAKPTVKQRAKAQPERAVKGSEKNSIIKTHGFSVSFIAAKGGSEAVLNDIAACTTQLLVPQVDDIQNEKLEGPSRTVQSPAGGAPPSQFAPAGAVSPGQPGQPGHAAGTGRVNVPSPVFIVGEETVKSSFTVEIVDVSAPAPKKTSAK